MITPFTGDGGLDLDRIPGLVDFYAAHGCAGLFAVCQSSEMTFLSETEKTALASAVARANRGRMQIVASGHTATSLTGQLRQIEAMMQVPGVGAYVLVSNALDPENKGDEVFMKNFEASVRAFPEISFGIYECPKPYKRLVSTPCLREMAQSGRLVFLKDTCCDPGRIRERLVAVRGTELKLFNANAASFLDSCLHGAAGYNGVMANFHPDLYRWVIGHAETETAKLLSNLLTQFAMIEMRAYPVSAKYHMNLAGVPMNLHSRSCDCGRFDQNARSEVDSLFALENELRSRLAIGR
jgi:4-hydroxy-tetrahydrodipicolinate synthase